MPNAIILKPGKDKPIHHRHPWVYSGAIGRILPGEGKQPPSPGEVVQIKGADGAVLGWGYYNPHSQIAVRLLSWDQNASIDDEWWRTMMVAAINRRHDLHADRDSTACRLVHAEADGLPGLIVDRYGGHLVIQSQTAGIDAVKSAIVDILSDVIHPAGILERSEGTARELEGLAGAEGVLLGAAPNGPVEIREGGHRFLVDLSSGQKTGFYLDQHVNRRRVATYAAGRDVLDCFCYTGAFTIYALAAGARRVTCVDSSEPALELLRQNVALNAPAGDDTAARVESIPGNAFEVLRRFRDSARAFDMVVLDPPKLAANRAQLDKALRAYKDLNLLAMKLLRPDGILATFSCSGAVNVAAFQEMIAWAATDAQRSVQVLERLSQAPDHPILVSFPESEYLKGLICRVV